MSQQHSRMTHSSLIKTKLSPFFIDLEKTTKSCFLGMSCQCNFTINFFQRSSIAWNNFAKSIRKIVRLLFDHQNSLSLQLLSAQLLSVLNNRNLFGCLVCSSFTRLCLAHVRLHLSPSPTTPISVAMVCFLNLTIISATLRTLAHHRVDFIFFDSETTRHCGFLGRDSATPSHA